jgi:hypothetical protein
MKIVAFLIANLIFWTGITGAQVIQEIPHSGQVRKVNTYFIEAVDCAGYLEIYLYDYSMNPIRNFGLKGEVIFTERDNTRTTSRLFPFSIDCFTAAPPQQGYATFLVHITGESLDLKVEFKDVVCRNPESN